MSWKAELTPADADLCRRDIALPGLSMVLKASAAAAAMGLGDLRQTYLRYKPGTNCVAGLVPPDGSLRAWTVISYPAERWLDIQRRPKWTAGEHKALYDDDCYTVFVPMALERRLPQARRLSDVNARMKLLRKIGLAGCDLKVLRYKPGRRIVLRADGPDAPCGIVKLHAKEKAFLRALAGAEHAQSLGGPEVIGVSRKYLALATAWTPGHVLLPSAEPADFVLAGAELARFHAAKRTDNLPQWSSPRAQQATDAITALLPQLAAQTQDLATKLPPIPRDVPVALHGDFSADQVVCGPTGATILDWDNAACGPAARDLGSAMARFDLDAIRGTPAQEACAALLDGYAAVRPLPDAAAITSHRAHALLALAVEGFRNRRPDWRRDAQCVLDQVKRLCEQNWSHNGPSQIDGLSEALDPKMMQKSFGPTLSGVSLTRLKPGRRAMVRYQMADGSVMFGKIRCKGPDRHAPKIQAGFQAAGLDGTDGVGVPAVVGVCKQPAMWLQEAVVGRSLSDMLDGPESDAKDAMQRTGRALAILHNTQPQTHRRWTHDNEFSVLNNALGKPQHADLLSTAKACLMALPSVPDVGLHRDFYFDQVLVAPQTIWLVDLDLHACGDAAVDIGNFTAHLTEYALRLGKPSQYFYALQTAFIAGYESGREVPDTARIDTLHWISLARHISIAERFPDRRHAIKGIEKACRDGLGLDPSRN